MAMVSCVGLPMKAVILAALASLALVGCELASPAPARLRRGRTGWSGPG